MKHLSVRPLLAAALILLTGACDSPAPSEPLPPPEVPIVDTGVPVAKIVVSPALDSLDVGDELQLSAVVLDSAGRPLESARVEWSSGNPDVVSIDADGKATVIASVPGVFGVTISARAGGEAGTALLYMYAPPPSFRLDVPGRILVGRSRPVGGAVPAQVGWTIRKREPHEFRWSSSDSAVVSVSATGVLTARRPGTAVVTAVLGGLTRSGTVEVVAGGYTLTPLGTLGGARTIPADLNDRAQVVGSSETAAGETHAFLWEGGRITDLGTLRDRSVATAINNQGVIVGSTLTPAHDRVTEPVRWVDGKLIPLPATTLAYSGAAVDVDERGRILVFEEPYTLFLWEAGDTVGLQGGGAPTYWFRVFGMNSAGVVVGSAWINPYPTAAMLAEGTVTRMASDRMDAAVRAINDAGRYVGHRTEHPSGIVHGFIGERGDTTSIGDLGGYVTRPAALNERGEVVGVATNSLRDARGFHWVAGRMTDLTDVLTDDDWVMVEASAINEAGQIVGRARNVTTGEVDGVLLTPSSP